MQWANKTNSNGHAHIQLMILANANKEEIHQMAYAKSKSRLISGQSLIMVLGSHILVNIFLSHLKLK